MTDSALPGRRWREHLGYLNWIYNPFHRLDASGVYDLIATRLPGQQGLYLNLGYWRDATNLDDASAALAMLVAETARMGPGDTVLDVGFGFADQDILWAQRLQPERIVGLNITASQVAVAQQRVRALGLDERIDLRHGSATEIPLADASVDKVVAVECAFHFLTRAQFFREAWRVLRPGGRLVTADIIPMPTQRALSRRLKHKITWGLAAGKFAIPRENAYTRPTYHAKLALAGFEHIRLESIRDQVYAPLHDYLRRNRKALTRLHPIARLPASVALRFDAGSAYAGLDYVLATAIKPQRVLRGRWTAG